MQKEKKTLRSEIGNRSHKAKAKRAALKASFSICVIKAFILSSPLEGPSYLIGQAVL